jgi:hypothetical protein
MFQIIQNLKRRDIEGTKYLVTEWKSRSVQGKVANLLEENGQ